MQAGPRCRVGIRSCMHACMPACSTNHLARSSNRRHHCRGRQDCERMNRRREVYVSFRVRLKRPQTEDPH